MVIMYFSKAFDTVPHRRLLHKINNYDITVSTFNWISNFLTNRKQIAVVDGENSEWNSQVRGVHVTVLGPLCFLMYNNDLPNNIKSTVRLLVDDCVMYTTI